MSPRRMAIAVFSLWLGVVLPTFAAAPPGWVIAGTAPTDFEFSVDPTAAASGKSSASITAKPGAKAGGFGTLMQSIAADNYRGGRWRLSGYLRTDAANRAQMWMRVDGSGTKVLGFDNMDSRPVTGTTQWTRYEVVLDVPMESVDIAFGFGLIGSGRVWGADFKLEKVATMVPITSAGPTLAKAPVNLDFEDTGMNQTTGNATSNVLATWEPRTLKLVAVYGASCDYFAARTRFEILQLGARDLKIDARDCLAKENVHAAQGDTSIDVTFSVLVPANKSDATASGDLVQAHWQIVEFHTGDVGLADCADLRYVTVKMLPSFSTRDIKDISKSVCNATGVGLRAEILMPTQPLATSAAAAAVTAAATTAASETALSRQTAVWTTRTLHNFGDTSVASCEWLVEDVRFLLLQFGARPSDLHIDDRGCTSHGISRDDIVVFRSVDATFSVLVPANKSDGKAKGDMVEARWQAVEVGPGDTGFTGLRSCAHLKYVTQTILPLFSARNVKLIPDGVCNKAVGLRAEVLVSATPQLKESR